jgi:hypothetical protein
MTSPSNGAKLMGEAYFKVSCPACDQHIEVPTELIEQSVVCPNCNQGFVVPRSSIPPKRTEPNWLTGLIIVLVAVVLFFATSFLFRLKVPFVFLLSMAAPLLFVYGLAYLIVCLAARRKAGMRVGVWKFQTSLVSLISSCCVVGLLLWAGSMFLKEQRDSDWHFGAQYIHTSDKRDAPKFEAAERAIRGKLVSPSSAKFETIAQILHDEKDDDLAYVRIEVDSQNRYGAMVHSKWQVDLRKHKLDKEEWWSPRNVKMIETSEK